VRFTHVAYLGDRTLLSADFRQGLTLRIWGLLWELGIEPEPWTVPWKQVSAFWPLFKPNGARFLRRQGLWPDRAEFPLAFDAPDRLPPILDPPRPWAPVAFGPDGEVAVYCETVVTNGFYSARFHLRDATGELHSFFHATTSFYSCAAFSPDGRFVAMSGGDRQVAVWDVASRRELVRLEQSDSVRNIAFTGGDRLVVVAGRTVRLWDVSRKNRFFKIPTFRKHAESLAVSPDLSRFAVGSRDGTVRVWDSASGQERGNYDWGVSKIGTLAFAPDGGTIAAAGASGIIFWDVD
jgi:WD40 repeat protein